MYLLGLCIFLVTDVLFSSGTIPFDLIQRTRIFIDGKSVTQPLHLRITDTHYHRVKIRLIGHYVTNIFIIATFCISALIAGKDFNRRLWVAHDQAFTRFLIRIRFVYQFIRSTSLFCFFLAVFAITAER